MLRTLVMLLLLLCLTAAEWRVSLDAGRFDTQTTVDNQGHLIQARVAPDCKLPVRNSLAACGPLWVAKLDAAGKTIAFATYLGTGDGNALFLKSVTTDRDGNILLLISAGQAGLPVVNAAQSDLKGSVNLYVCKIAADGSRVVYGTYLGGSQTDTPQALTVDGRGAAWVLGFISSKDFPVTPGAPVSVAIARASISRFSPSGALEYSGSVDYGSIAPTIQVDESGAALLNLYTQLWRVSPDTGAIERTGVQSIGLGYWPVLEASAGTVWMAGTATNGMIPVTGNAAQSTTGGSPLLRVVGGQVLAPARQVAAHRVNGFALDPHDPGRVFAATDAGLFASEDNGATWGLLFEEAVNSVAVDPANPNVMWLGNLGLYRSEDRGRTWTASGAGVQGVVTSIAADPHVPGLVYAAGRDLYRSEDGGVNWKSYTFPGVPGGTPSSSLFTTPVVVRLDPFTARRLWVLATSQCIGFCPVLPSLYRSDDGGATVTRVPATAASDTGSDLVVDSVSGDPYMLNGGTVLAFRGGERLERLSIQGAVALTADAGQLYAGLSDGEIVRSGDGGATWTRLATLPRGASRLAVSAGQTVQVGQALNSTDGFVLQYDLSGKLLYGSYLGGGATEIKAAGLGTNGHLYVAGVTGRGLPVRNARQSKYGGGVTDGFVAEFDGAGALLEVTYLGGPGDDAVDGLVMQGDGAVVVTGTTSAGFPGLEDSALGPGTRFVVRLEPFGRRTARSKL